MLNLVELWVLRSSAVSSNVAEKGLVDGSKLCDGVSFAEERAEEDDLLVFFRLLFTRVRKVVKSGMSSKESMESSSSVERLA